MKYRNRFLFALLLVSWIFPVAAQNLLPLEEREVQTEALYRINSEGTGVIHVTFTLPEGLHQIDDRDFFKLTLDDPHWEMGEVIYPPSRDYGSFVGWEGEISLEAPLRFVGKGEQTVPGVRAHYQLCDDKGICRRPETEVLEPIFSEALNLSPSEGGGKQKGGKALFLLFAFLGGLLLNIMPCVLPVLFLKALHLVEHSGDSRRKIFFNSLSYALGILTSLLILGGVVIAIKASGTFLGWGFQFQNPVFVVILTSLILLFSLSLFEVFFINPPQGAGKLAGNQKNRGYGGSFVTGIVAVLLATPCTAPLLGTALGFAFSQSGGLILLFFSLIGVGFSFPYILLGIFPGVVKKLPRPGEWMNRFREIMGFLLMGTVVYLLTILHGQLGADFKGVLWFLLFLSLTAWLLGQSQRTVKIKRTVLMTAALVILLAGAFLFLPRDRTTVGNVTSLSKGEDSLPFSPEAVGEIRKEGKPLFLEFTADWCSTCRTNHLTVLDRPFRKDLFEEAGVVYMIGDYTLNDPIIGQWLSDYGRVGVPFYLYFPPGEEGVILPEVLTRGILERTIREK